MRELWNQRFAQMDGHMERDRMHISNPVSKKLTPTLACFPADGRKECCLGSIKRMGMYGI